jgi:hypothetical protein
LPAFSSKRLGQQLGVVDVGAVRRVAVAARAGVHADRAAVRGENRDRARLFRSMKLLQEIARWDRS